MRRVNGQAATHIDSFIVDASIFRGIPPPGGVAFSVALSKVCTLVRCRGVGGERLVFVAAVSRVLTNLDPRRCLALFGLSVCG